MHDNVNSYIDDYVDGSVAIGTIHDAHIANA
jgi:hypothetical protein